MPTSYKFGTLSFGGRLTYAVNAEPHLEDGEDLDGGSVDVTTIATTHLTIDQVEVATSDVTVKLPNGNEETYPANKTITFRAQSLQESELDVELDIEVVGLINTIQTFLGIIPIREYA